MNERMQSYLLYGFMVIVVLAAAWAVSGLFAQPQSHTTERFQQMESAKAGSGGQDLCAPPDGVSKEDWQTHMSHHPDMYPGCL